MKKSTKMSVIIIILLSLLYISEKDVKKKPTVSPVQTVRDTISIMPVDTLRDELIGYYLDFAPDYITEGTSLIKDYNAQ